MWPKKSKKLLELGATAPAPLAQPAVPTNELNDFHDRPTEFTGKMNQSRFGRIKKAMQIKTTPRS